MHNNEIITNYILAIISSGIISTILSYILYSKKLKKENIFKENSIISNEISNSLKEYRKLVLELKIYEILDAEYEFNTRGYNVDVFGIEPKYHAIFNTIDTYIEYWNKIQDFRKKNENNLPCNIALSSLYIDNYLMKLALYMKQFNNPSTLPILGFLFFHDLNKWMVKTDKMIVKEINKHRYKLESHEIPKWKRLRKRIVEKEYNNTLLYYLTTGNCKKKNYKVFQVIKQFIDTLL